MKQWIFVGMLLLLVSCNVGCSTTNHKAPPTRPKQSQKDTERSHLTKKLTDNPVIPQPSIVKQKQQQIGIIPVQLYIPEVGIYAKVEPVSILDDGQMDVPQSTDRVGYLASTGVLPGAKGNAIMDGHVDTYDGPAVFFRLNKLKKGDAIVVKGNKGEKIPFIVESVEIFKNSEAPIQKVFGITDDARLNLITCAGKYSRSKKEHESRLVVFAKRAS